MFSKIGSITLRTAVCTTRSSTAGTPSGLSSLLPSLGIQTRLTGWGGVLPFSQHVLHLFQPVGAFPQILLCFLAIHSGSALVLHDRFQGALQVFHLPYFIYQAEPFASFDSSFEGFQHAFCPHACFRPVPSLGDFSALFSQRHSRQFELRLCFFHASTFLSPLAPRSLPASSLLRGL